MLIARHGNHHVISVIGCLENSDGHKKYIGNNIGRPIGALFRLFVDRRGKQIMLKRMILIIDTENKLNITKMQYQVMSGLNGKYFCINPTYPDIHHPLR